MEKIKSKIVSLLLIYIVAWMVIMPFWGTVRCANWNSEPKCDKLKIGFINPFFSWEKEYGHLIDSE